MTFATAFLVVGSAFVVMVPIAMVAILVVAAPGRPRLATARAHARSVRLRSAEHAQPAVAAGKAAA